MLHKRLFPVPLVARGYDPDTVALLNNGALDDNTKKNIKIFQQKFNESAKGLGNPERLTVDGRVSRARGHFSWDKNRPWTIVKLNAVTSWYIRMRGGKSAAEFIANVYPDVAKLLKLDPNDV